MNNVNPSNQQSQAEDQEKTGGLKTKELATLDKIRPELNLEKWSIWQPSKSQNQPKERILLREITLPDRSQITAKVEVGFTNKGVLNTEDQKTYYALIKHWEDKGRSIGQVSFSLRQLAKILKSGKWGTNVIKSLTQSLRRLRATPFTWENSYFDSSTKETLEILDTFTILSELKIITRKKDGHITKEAGYFRFNNFILKNLLANHTKPLLLNIILSFKSEIAQLLYTYLDLILADKNHYERRTKELFDDLGLEGEGYKYPSIRKQKLEKALEELQGAPLTTGVISSATLKKTKDKRDFKIVVRKKSLRRKQEVSSAEPNGALPESRGEQLSLPPPKDEITLEAEELVKYFYTLFHGADTAEKHYPTSKEKDQATSLIAQHGEEKARYIIDFAHKKAPETKYKPQTFGGIRHYESKALADLEAKTKAEEVLKKTEAMKQEKERQEREKREKEKQELDEFYQSLTRDEQRRVDQEAMENLNDYPFIGDRIRQQGEKAFSSDIVRVTLEAERKKILKRLRQERAV